MPKKSKKPGKPISPSAEIQSISHQGIWIFFDGQEFFMPFSQFPWFLRATIEQIYNLQVFHKGHLHWPELDIDIDIESIKTPSAYPLVYV